MATQVKKDVQANKRSASRSKSRSRSRSRSPARKSKNSQSRSHSRSRSRSYSSRSSRSSSRSRSRSSSRSRSPRKSSPQRKRSPTPESRTLFVDALTRNVTKEHLTEIFGKYGKLKSTELLWDKRANLPKGSAYIEFFERPEAEKAQLYMNEGQMDGNKIKVNFVLPRRRTPPYMRGSRRFSPPRRRPFGSRGGYRGSGGYRGGSGYGRRPNWGGGGNRRSPVRRSPYRPRSKSPRRSKRSPSSSRSRSPPKRKRSYTKSPSRSRSRSK